MHSAGRGAARTTDATRLIDVATFAGVSIATASQALNGGPVAAATRARIIEAADKLHYVPRSSAQNLRTGRGRTLGMWIVNRPGAVELTEDSAFFYPLIRGAMDGAQAAGLRMTLRVLNAPMQDVAATLAAEAGGGVYAAFVLVPQWQNDGAYVLGARNHGLPVVAINDPSSSADAVAMIDNEIGVAEALTHLVRMGHRRVGYLAGPIDHLDAERRLQSFYRIAAEIGIRVREPYIHRGDFTIAAGAAGLKQLIESCTAAGIDRPSALLAADDYVAAGALQEAARRGMSVPGDLSIMGYDDVDVARATAPPLSTIRQPLFELGIAAAALAAALSRGEAVERVTRLAPSLVARESVREHVESEMR